MNHPYDRASKRNRELGSIQTQKVTIQAAIYLKTVSVKIHVSNLPSSSLPERKPPRGKKYNRFSNRHTLPKQSAICVQRFDDSRDSAIHITYRISLRSSSLREPRDPLSKVISLRSHSVKHKGVYKFGHFSQLRDPYPSNATVHKGLVPAQSLREERTGNHLVMIQPQVHLRLPCYDF